MTITAVIVGRRLDRVAACLAAALFSNAAVAQEVEQVSSGQRAGTVLLAGVRHTLNADKTLQIDAGGGHTTNVNSDIAYVRLTARPAKFASVFVNYVYVATAANPGPRGRLHIARAGGELMQDIGPFKIANQAELELLAAADQPDIGRGRNQLRVYYSMPRLAPALDLKLFASEELIFRFGRGLDRDRITAGARITANRRVEFNLYYLGDRPHSGSTRPRVGYAILQLTLTV